MTKEQLTQIKQSLKSALSIAIQYELIYLMQDNEKQGVMKPYLLDDEYELLGVSIEIIDLALSKL